jgi:hypothetical protein
MGDAAIAHRLTDRPASGTLASTATGRKSPEVLMSSPSRPARSLFAAVAVLALVVVACGSSSPPLTDPVEILQAGAASLGEMETVHVRGVIEGEMALDIGDAGGGPPLPLKGTTLDADVDVVNSALAVELLAPALFNLRLNLVVVDGISYLRAPILTGDSWVRQPAEGGIGGDPGAALEGLAAFLARPELQPEKLPDVRCAGTDCYSVQFTVAAQELADALDWLGSSIPGLSGAVGDVTVTVGVRKDDLNLAALSLVIPTGGTTPLTISLELTKVNEPVTIEAPPADQVKDAPG